MLSENDKFFDGVLGSNPFDDRRQGSDVSEHALIEMTCRFSSMFE